MDKKKNDKGFWFGCMSWPKCEQSYPSDDLGNPDYDYVGKKGGGMKKKTTKKKPKPKVMSALNRK